jgi:hypoxanthine phosphoribosyltransferase
VEPMSKMIHVTPRELLLDSLKLGRMLYATGFRPKHAISIWRGGTAVGIGVDAFFRNRGVTINHTTIATVSYMGVGHREEVVVKGLEHVIRSVCREDGLLIIDDVYETGNTIQKVLSILKERARANTPERIMVGTIHRKPEKMRFKDVEILSLHDVSGDSWIDYPHELADLVTEDSADPLIRAKDEAAWRVVREAHHEPTSEHIDPPYRYVPPEELQLDAQKLGVNIFADEKFQPDFIVALWPGGIAAGLPIHEVYKYKLKKTGQERKMPDHISLNTSSTHLTYRTNVIGLDYLAERINRDSNVLLVDSLFKSGRFINDALADLKEVLRRNLNEERVRVASVYWNRDDQSTWTVKPFVKRPHYYIKQVDGTVIYPHAFHRLIDPMNEVRRQFPEAHDVLFGG